MNASNKITRLATPEIEALSRSFTNLLMALLTLHFINEPGKETSRTARHIELHAFTVRFCQLKYNSSDTDIPDRRGFASRSDVPGLDKPAESTDQNSPGERVRNRRSLSFCVFDPILSVFKLVETCVSYLILAVLCGTGVPVVLVGLQFLWSGSDLVVGCVLLHC